MTASDDAYQTLLGKVGQPIRVGTDVLMLDSVSREGTRYYDEIVLTLSVYDPNQKQPELIEAMRSTTHQHPRLTGQMHGPEEE